ncbi:MAG: hypothetical protein Q9170_001223 [Blastenia crenularia]
MSTDFQSKGIDRPRNGEPSTEGIGFADTLGRDTDILDAGNPLGPVDLNVDIRFKFQPLRSELCYISSVRMLAWLISKPDPWSGPIHGGIRWQDSEYPGLEIAVDTPERDGSIVGHIFFWAMARILHQMTRVDWFFDSGSTIRWRGVPVGKISFTLKDLLHLGSGHGTKSPEAVSSNYTAAAISLERNVTFTPVPGVTLLEKDVFMATVGALIHLASYRSIPPDVFEGGFPGVPGVFPAYNASISWTNQHSPEPRQPLDKPLLLQCMVESVVYGLNHRAFGALDAVAFQDGLQIATGGCYPLPSTRLRSRN